MIQNSLISTTSQSTINGHHGGNGHHRFQSNTYLPTAVDVIISPPETVIKRDGRLVPFDSDRIESALARCFASLEHRPKSRISDLVHQVINVVAAKYSQPSVENVQDIVEIVLQAAGEYEAAKHYILYRAEHAKLREWRPIPLVVRDAFAESDEYFPTQLQKFQFYDKYSRFNYDLGRRETWLETVNRSVEFLKELSDYRLPDKTYQRIHQGILNMDAMPSMRLLAMAGPAARRNNIAIYNCSYMPIDSIDAFVEALIISMSGCGVGYSVERRYVENLPRIKRQSGAPAKTFIIPDTSEGWAEAVRIGLESWFAGSDVKFDYSLIRPAGTPLHIKGGRASGPEPLRKMLDFARNRILSRQGGFLRSLDAHDMMCIVGEAAVSGGVRRTAMISLFDYDDMEMRHCKDGDFWQNNSQRWNANNSAVWPEYELSQAEVARYVLDIVESGRGEPGIFSRKAAKEQLPPRRQPAEFGTNPCGEINLRPQQFCNLTIAVARPDDTFESLKEKVELATIIGTIQSMATYFPGLRRKWQKNCEEERLLGVDITGQLDSPVAQDAQIQDLLRQHAIAVNRQTAAMLGINQSAAVTCVKPSGNSSQLLNCSAGLHARWAAYYIRNVRVSAHSPLYKVLRDAAVPMDPENGQTAENATTWVIHFPVKSPAEAITRHDRSAIEQCNYWLQCKTHWTEHNPSCFAGDTRFITDQGLRAFNQFQEGDSVKVLNAKGQWVDATVHEYGEQEIWDMVVERNSIEHTIRTTAHHLWPVMSTQNRFGGDKAQVLRTDQLLTTKKKLLTVNPDVKLEMQPSGFWKVVDIRPTGKHERVYCVEEPTEQQFVLEGNILTHNCTITYRPDEVLDLMNWIWEHQDKIGGMAFLPASDAQYKQMPYEEIEAEEYYQLAEKFPSIDFSKIYRYEEEDLTTAAQEFACLAGACDI